MLAAAEADFEPDIIDVRREQAGEIGRSRVADVERDAAANARSDRPGAAKLVALAPPEERAVRMRSVIPGRCIAMGGIAPCAVHRRVWYSRCNSRARGSIDEIYICS